MIVSSRYQEQQSSIPILEIDGGRGMRVKVGEGRLKQDMVGDRAQRVFRIPSVNPLR
jgi:hypothetical protein